MCKWHPRKDALHVPLTTHRHTSCTLTSQELPYILWTQSYLKCRHILITIVNRNYCLQSVIPVCTEDDRGRHWCLILSYSELKNFKCQPFQYLPHTAYILNSTLLLKNLDSEINIHINHQSTTTVVLAQIEMTLSKNVITVGGVGAMKPLRDFMCCGQVYVFMLAACP